MVLNVPRPVGAAAAGLIDELRGWVAEQLSPIAKPDEIRLTDNLPKTRSGKIMRRLLRSIARGEEITQDMSTLENPGILEQLRGGLPPSAAAQAAPSKRAASGKRAAQGATAAKSTAAAEGAAAAKSTAAAKGTAGAKGAAAAKRAAAAKGTAATKKTPIRAKPKKGAAATQRPKAAKKTHAMAKRGKSIVGGKPARSAAVRTRRVPAKTRGAAVKTRRAGVKTRGAVSEGRRGAINTARSKRPAGSKPPGRNKPRSGSKAHGKK